jgi:hypothetical protein
MGKSDKPGGKKIYARPLLTNHGTVEKLTLGKGQANRNDHGNPRLLGTH